MRRTTRAAHAAEFDDRSSRRTISTAQAVDIFRGKLRQGNRKSRPARERFGHPEELAKQRLEGWTLTGNTRAHPHRESKRHKRYFRAPLAAPRLGLLFFCI